MATPGMSAAAEAGSGDSVARTSSLLRHSVTFMEDTTRVGRRSTASSSGRVGVSEAEFGRPFLTHVAAPAGRRHAEHLARGLLAPAARDANGYRQYDESQIARAG